MIPSAHPLLKKIMIKTKRAVFSEIIGQNSSNRQGEGYDFAELREYEYGEDIKHIDWTISAKMQKLYTKRFYEQKELNIILAPILTGSVMFGSQKLKQTLIAEICSLLGYSAIKQGDPFESYIINKTIKLNTPQSKQFFTLYQMTDQLLKYFAVGQNIDYATLCHRLYKTIKRRSILFIIGDFFDAHTFNVKLLNKKHEVFIIMVRDPLEEKPFTTGEVQLIDPSTHAIFEGNITKSMIQRYEKKLHTNDHNFLEQIQKQGIQWTKIYTDEDPLSKLIPLLKKV